MLHQVGLGIVLMTATVFTHTGCTLLLLRVLKAIHVERWGLKSLKAGALVISGAVALLLLAGILEAAIWAVAYLQTGAFSSFEEAMYFSVVSFTTLGLGDITLSEQWRLLGAFEAANGIVMFGWSTALVFAFVQRVAQARISSWHAVKR